MLEVLLPLLRTPRLGLPGLSVSPEGPVRRRGGLLLDATLVGPGGADPSSVERGIWDARGTLGPPRTLAQLSNIVPPVPQLYERVWRRRSLSLLSRRPFSVDEELAELEHALGDLDGATVVDIGCSEGLYARRVAAKGGRVLGVDHSTAFLRRMLARAAREDLAIAAVRAVAQQLPIRDGVLDGAVMGGSLNELGDRAGAFADVARVLRPGGRFFMMSLVRAPTARGRAAQHAARLAGIVFPSVEETLTGLEAADLEVVDRRLDGVVLRTTAVRS